MTIVLWIAAGMLSVAGLLALARIARGPSSLDRVVALDVLLSCLIAGIGLEAAYNQHGLTLPVLAVLALLGFVGAVTVARFGADSESDEPAEPLVRDDVLVVDAAALPDDAVVIDDARTRDEETER